MWQKAGSTLFRAARLMTLTPSLSALINASSMRLLMPSWENGKKYRKTRYKSILSLFKFLGQLFCNIHKPANEIGKWLFLAMFFLSIISTNRWLRKWTILKVINNIKFFMKLIMLLWVHAMLWGFLNIYMRITIVLSHHVMKTCEVLSYSHVQVLRYIFKFLSIYNMCLWYCVFLSLLKAVGLHILQCTLPPRR